MTVLKVGRIPRSAPRLRQGTSFSDRKHHRTCPGNASPGTPPTLQAKDVWEDALSLKSRLSDAVAIQDFGAAARLRDELEAIDLSAVQLMELDCVHQLGSGKTEEQILSLRKIAQLPACEATQASVASCLRDSKLTEHAELTLKAVWFRHPTNEAVNDLMRQGLPQLQTAATFPAALATYQQATELDPLFAEAWNKVATVLFLQRRFAESIDACETVLALNPLHYAALSGKGLCHAGVDQHMDAIECFRRALKIHPYLSAVKNQLAMLEQEYL